jgi:general stress protein 26
MSETGSERVGRLLNTVRNAAMATVNEDGTPHNTPFHYIIDDAFTHIYLVSSPDARHSRNLLRNGQAFIVIYDSNIPEGLYMEAENATTLDGDRLLEGMAVWNARRAQEGNEPLEPSFIAKGSPQCMYRLDIVRFWVNEVERDDQNRIIRDYRREVNREDLIS